MKKYTWILGGLMAMAITACTSDELMERPEQHPTEGEVVSVTAYVPGSNPDSRIAFTETENTEENKARYTLSWETSDQFSVIRGGQSKTFTKEAGDGNTFTGVLPGSSGTYYAIYPAITSGPADASAVPFDLSTQTGELDASKTYMRATSSDGQTFSFSHCTAILKATFSFLELPEDATIKQIKVTTPEAYKVNGTINLSNGTLTGPTENGTNDITITIPPVEEEPISQAEGEEAYYIYLPPMPDNVVKTLTFQVTMSDDAVYTGTISRNGAIEAGKLYTATVVLTEVIPYVTFKAVNGQTLKLKQKITEEPSYDPEEEYVSVPQPYPGVGGDTGYIEYSVGNSNEWTRFTPESQPVSFGGDKGDLRLRGISPNGTLKAQIVFGNDTPVACSGDIRTLVDYTNYETKSTANACFNGLFENCSGLADASKLKLISNNNEMAESCYNSMFSGCTSLTSAPALPATTLAESCYNSMFSGCTSLTAAPALPATTLATYCYKRMFQGCTSLTTAPELPATTLTSSCYRDMFNGCTSLTSAPALSATTLAAYCYVDMFNSCTSLKSAPALPVTTLATHCYEGMFQGCTSLTTAPELPATTLVDNCYNRMFDGCTSLTTAPELPAEQLETSCYRSMFNGCTKLNRVTMLATNIPENKGCLANWLKDVATTGTFTKAASMTSLPTGASGIPDGWSVQDQGGWS